MKPRHFSIRSYASLAAAFLACDKLSSQVIIQDYDPDLRLMNWEAAGIDIDSMTIDIDSNGVYDLLFEFEIGWGWDPIINIEIYDAVLAIGAVMTSDLAASNVYAFNEGDFISSDLHWKYDGQAIETGSVWFTSSGCTISLNYAFSETNQFLALKLNIDDSIHYGWARLHVDALTGGVCNSGVGSPLTIFEIGYESTPGEPVLCIDNTCGQDHIWGGKLKQSYDSDNFSEFKYNFFATGIDYSELRFYLTPSISDVIDFSVIDALSVDATRYTSVNSDEIAISEYNDVIFDSTMVDINGDPFSASNYYSGFYLKIPPIGGSEELALSNAFSIIKSESNNCSLEVDYAELVVIDNTGTAADFNIVFSADTDESDINGYYVSLIKMPFFPYDISDVYIDGRSIFIPKSGADEYIVNLAPLTNDIIGNIIHPGEDYFPVIFCEGDGYYYDLECSYQGENSSQLPTSIISTNGVEVEFLYTNNQLLTTTPPELLSEQCRLEIRTIAGQKILEQVINNTTTMTELNQIAPGIYFAVIISDMRQVAVLKIVVQ